MSRARDAAELLIKTSSGRVAALSSHLRPPMATSSFSSPSSSSYEVEAALAVAPSSDVPTIFDKIIKKEIPSKVVYEDDKKRLEMSTKNSESLLGVKNFEAKYQNTAVRTIPATVCLKPPSAASPLPVLIVVASAAVVVAAATAYTSRIRIYRLL